MRTRRALLTAAAEVFDEVGFTAANVTDVLERSGVTKGAFYFHFASKAQLGQAVMDEQTKALPAVPDRELKLQQSMDEALLLAMLLGPETGDPIIRGGVRLTVEYGEGRGALDGRPPMKAWIEHTASVFSEAKAQEEIWPDTDVPILARLFVGAFTGVQELSRIMTDREDMAERVLDLYRHLLPSVAVPTILPRLDFSPERGRKVYEEVVKAREAGEAAP